MFSSPTIKHLKKKKNFPNVKLSISLMLGAWQAAEQRLRPQKALLQLSSFQQRGWRFRAGLRGKGRG